MAKATRTAVRWALPLLCAAVFLSPGCKAKQPARTPARTGSKGADPGVLLPPGPEVEMTVKVYRHDKGPGRLLREMKKTLSTTGPTELKPGNDKSIGTPWNGASQYQIEYHWPSVEIASGKAGAPGGELTHAVTLDRRWTYLISGIDGQTQLILRGGIVSHVLRLPEGKKTHSDIVDPAIAWIDKDVAARLARYAQDSKELQAQTPSR